MHRGEHS